MRDIICAGCSHTSYRKLSRELITDGYIPNMMYGYTPQTDVYHTKNSSYPEAICRNFGNKVYNAGLMSNSVASSVLSIMSIASRLMRQGNNNFSVILQSTDFERQHLYLSDDVRKFKKINKTSKRPLTNNYLFGDNTSGFLQMGGMSQINDNYTDCEVIMKMAKAYSEHLYSNENCTINALTHLLLLQNFCKVNNIPYKIFTMMDLFSSPIFPFFDIDYTNHNTYFKSYFIDKKLPKKNTARLRQIR